MGRGLAGEEKMEIVEQHLPAEWLMSVNIIAQQGVVARRITLGVSGQPAFGGVDLAVLFDLPILWPDELRA